MGGWEIILISFGIIAATIIIGILVFLGFDYHQKEKRKKTKPSEKKLKKKLMEEFIENQRLDVM